MLRNAFRLLTGLGLLAVGGSTVVYASGLPLGPACPTATLGTYVADFSTSPGCSLGNLDVYNFFGAASNGSSPDSSALNNVLVTPDPTNYTFTFSNFGSLFSSDPSMTINYTIDPAPVVLGQRIGLDPPTGDVTVTQYYCGAGTFQNLILTSGGNGNCSGTFLGTNSVTPSIPLASITFGTAYSLVDTQALISIGSGGGSFDALSTTAVLPEPATAGLAGVALLGLFLKRRASMRRR